MGFKLPSYPELTDQQRSVLNIPIDRDFVVSGPPGSGKTVCAVYRAANLCRLKKKVLLLVFNVPLYQFIRKALEKNGIDAEYNTFHSWICTFYHEQFGGTIPVYNRLAYHYDWETVYEKFSGLGFVYDTVILDEAQDLPVELIKALKLISRTVNCFKDERQVISLSRTASEDTAEDVLHVRSSYKLCDNFRNPKEIYNLARLYSDEEEVKVKRTSNRLPMVIKCRDYKSELDQIVKIIERDYKYGFIGIFVEYNELGTVYDFLKEALAGKRNVYYYDSDNQYLDFDAKGIYVITMNCMKGLEFESVIIPSFCSIRLTCDSSLERNVLYVAISRSAESFYALHSGEKKYKGYNALAQLKGHEQLVKWYDTGDKNNG